MPTVRVNDLDTGGAAAGDNVANVAWAPTTRVVSKTNMFNAYTWAEGDYLQVVGCTTNAVKQPGSAAAFSANDVTAAQPLALPIIRKIDNTSVEVGVMVSASALDGTTTHMTVVNSVYTSEEVSDIVIDGVSGSVKASNHGMGIGLDDTADATVKLTQAVHRRITLRNVAITVPSSGFSMIQCAAIGLRELTLEGNIQLANGSSGDAVLFNNTSSRTLMNFHDASRAVWRARPSGTGAFSLVSQEAAARVYRAGSFDVVSSQTGGACTLLNLVGADSIIPRFDDFSAGDIRAEAIASGSLLRGIVCYNGNGSQVRRGIVNSIDLVNAAEGISGAINTGATAGLRSRFHVNSFRMIGTIAVAAVRGQADVTYDNCVRDAGSGELAYGAANDTISAPSMQPSNTMTFTITEADFTAAATTQTVTLTSLTRYANHLLPRAASVVGVRVEVVTAFTGGGITAATLDVGITATPTRFVAGFDVFNVGGTYATPSAANAYFAESAGWPALAVRLNTTTGNVVDANAGIAKVTVTFE
jgi:hypothetical protein